MESRRDRGEWERVRWQSALILNMFAKKGKTIKPTELVVFPWEETPGSAPPPPVVLSAEEQAKRFAKYDKKMRERWGKAG